jgi:alpha-beta hydrolase superfamily lysophospholipase
MPTSLTTPDGLVLRVHEWPVADARGSVLIVHGLGEHIGRHADVAAQLNAWGWHVVGFDQRGHGRSDGSRGRIESHDSLLRDLGQVVRAVHGEHPAPLVLLGHSLGGLIAARFVAEGLQPQPAAWHAPVDALVLSSPALDVGTSAMQKLLLAVLGRLAPDLAVNNGLKPAWLAHDRAVVDAYIADPLVHDRITPRLAHFIVDEGVFVRRCAAQWRVPTLLMWAVRDRCVAPAGSAAFAAAAPAGVVEAHALAPLFHEIFNEPERAQVFEQLRAWLARSPAATAGSALRA